MVGLDPTISGRTTRDPRVKPEDDGFLGSALSAPCLRQASKSTLVCGSVARIEPLDRTAAQHLLGDAAGMLVCRATSTARLVDSRRAVG
jgi:hypothetical protein